MVESEESETENLEFSDKKDVCPHHCLDHEEVDQCLDTLGHPIRFPTHKAMPQSIVIENDYLFTSIELQSRLENAGWLGLESVALGVFFWIYYFLAPPRFLMKSSFSGLKKSGLAADLTSSNIQIFFAMTICMLKVYFTYMARLQWRISETDGVNANIVQLEKKIELFQYRLVYLREFLKTYEVHQGYDLVLHDHCHLVKRDPCHGDIPYLRRFPTATEPFLASIQHRVERIWKLVRIAVTHEYILDQYATELHKRRSNLGRLTDGLKYIGLGSVLDLFCWSSLPLSIMFFVEFAQITIVSELSNRDSRVGQHKPIPSLTWQDFGIPNAPTDLEHNEAAPGHHGNDGRSPDVWPLAQVPLTLSAASRQVEARLSMWRQRKMPLLTLLLAGISLYAVTAKEHAQTFLWMKRLDRLLTAPVMNRWLAVSLCVGIVSFFVAHRLTPLIQYYVANPESKVREHLLDVEGIARGAAFVCFPKFEELLPPVTDLPPEADPFLHQRRWSRSQKCEEERALDRDIAALSPEEAAASPADCPMAALREERRLALQQRSGPQEHVYPAKSCALPSVYSSFSEEARDTLSLYHDAYLQMGDRERAQMDRDFMAAQSKMDDTVRHFQGDFQLAAGLPVLIRILEYHRVHVQKDTSLPCSDRTSTAPWTLHPFLQPLERNFQQYPPKTWQAVNAWVENMKRDKGACLLPEWCPAEKVTPEEMRALTAMFCDLDRVYGTFFAAQHNNGVAMARHVLDLDDLKDMMSLLPMLTPLPYVPEYQQCKQWTVGRLPDIHTLLLMRHRDARVRRNAVQLDALKRMVLAVRHEGPEADRLFELHVRDRMDQWQHYIDGLEMKKEHEKQQGCLMDLEGGKEEKKEEKEKKKTRWWWWPWATTEQEEKKDSSSLVPAYWQLLEEARQGNVAHLEAEPSEPARCHSRALQPARWSVPEERSECLYAGPRIPSRRYRLMAVHCDLPSEDVCAWLYPIYAAKKEYFAQRVFQCLLKEEARLLASCRGLKQRMIVERQQVCQHQHMDRLWKQQLSDYVERQQGPLKRYFQSHTFTAADSLLNESDEEVIQEEEEGIENNNNHHEMEQNHPHDRERLYRSSVYAAASHGKGADRRERPLKDFEVHVRQPPRAPPKTCVPVQKSRCPVDPTRSSHGYAGFRVRHMLRQCSSLHPPKVTMKKKRSGWHHQENENEDDEMDERDEMDEDKMDENKMDENKMDAIDGMDEINAMDGMDGDDKQDKQDAPISSPFLMETTCPPMFYFRVGMLRDLQIAQLMDRSAASSPRRRIVLPLELALESVDPRDLDDQQLLRRAMHAVREHALHLPATRNDIDDLADLYFLSTHFIHEEVSQRLDIHEQRRLKAASLYDDIKWGEYRAVEKCDLALLATYALSHTVSPYVTVPHVPSAHAVRATLLATDDDDDHTETCVREKQQRLRQSLLASTAYGSAQPLVCLTPDNELYHDAVRQYSCCEEVLGLLYPTALTHVSDDLSSAHAERDMPLFRYLRQRVHRQEQQKEREREREREREKKAREKKQSASMPSSNNLILPHPNPPLPLAMMTRSTWDRGISWLGARARSLVTDMAACDWWQAIPQNTVKASMTTALRQQRLVDAHSETLRAAERSIDDVEAGHAKKNDDDDSDAAQQHRERLWTHTVYRTATLLDIEGLALLLRSNDTQPRCMLLLGPLHRAVRSTPRFVVLPWEATELWRTATLSETHCPSSTSAPTVHWEDDHEGYLDEENNNIVPLDPVMEIVTPSVTAEREKGRVVGAVNAMSGWSQRDPDTLRDNAQHTLQRRQKERTVMRARTAHLILNPHRHKTPVPYIADLKTFEERMFAPLTVRFNRHLRTLADNRKSWKLQSLVKRALALQGTYVVDITPAADLDAVYRKHALHLARLRTEEQQHVARERALEAQREQAMRLALPYFATPLKPRRLSFSCSEQEAMDTRERVCRKLVYGGKENIAENHPQGIPLQGNSLQRVPMLAYHPQKFRAWLKENKMPFPSEENLSEETADAVSHHEQTVGASKALSVTRGASRRASEGRGASLYGCAQRPLPSNASIVRRPRASHDTVLGADKHRGHPAVIVSKKHNPSHQTSSHKSPSPPPAPPTRSHFRAWYCFPLRVVHFAIVLLLRSFLFVMAFCGVVNPRKTEVFMYVHMKAVRRMKLLKYAIPVMSGLCDMSANLCVSLVAARAFNQDLLFGDGLFAMTSRLLRAVGTFFVCHCLTSTLQIVLEVQSIGTGTFHMLEFGLLSHVLIPFVLFYVFERTYLDGVVAHGNTPLRVLPDHWWPRPWRLSAADRMLARPDAAAAISQPLRLLDRAPWVIYLLQGVQGRVLWVLDRTLWLFPVHQSMGCLRVLAFVCVVMGCVGLVHIYYVHVQQQHAIFHHDMTVLMTADDFSPTPAPTPPDPRQRVVRLVSMATGPETVVPEERPAQNQDMTQAELLRRIREVGAIETGALQSRWEKQRRDAEKTAKAEDAMGYRRSYGDPFGRREPAANPQMVREALHSLPGVYS